MALFSIPPTRLQDLQRKFEALNSAVVVSDARAPDMPIVMVNACFEAMTGYTHGEAIGRNCRFLQGEDRQQAALESLREAIKAGRSGYAVLRNYRRDGSAFLNELMVTPIQDQSGIVTHYVGLQRELIRAP